MYIRKTICRTLFFFLFSFKYLACVLFFKTKLYDMVTVFFLTQIRGRKWRLDILCYLQHKKSWNDSAFLSWFNYPFVFIQNWFSKVIIVWENEKKIFNELVASESLFHVFFRLKPSWPELCEGILLPTVQKTNTFYFFSCFHVFKCTVIQNKYIIGTIINRHQNKTVFFKRKTVFWNHNIQNRTLIS